MLKINGNILFVSWHCKIYDLDHSLFFSFKFSSGPCCHRKTYQRLGTPRACLLKELCNLELAGRNPVSKSHLAMSNCYKMCESSLGGNTWDLTEGMCLHSWAPPAAPPGLGEAPRV